MSETALKEHGVDNYSVSSEARDRIKSARLRDFMYGIGRLTSAANLAREDIESLALVVLAAIDEGVVVNPDRVYSSLIGQGRSKHKAEMLTSVLFKQSVQM